MKVIRTVLITFVLIYGMTPLPWRLELGIYKPWLDSIYCFNWANCVHEVGHKMDYDLGNPSHKTEFSQAVTFILLTEVDLINNKISNDAGFIMATPGFISQAQSLRYRDPHEELYAAYYAWHKGDISSMHPELRRFYSDDPKYMQLVECLVSGYIKVCGRSLHIHQEIEQDALASR